jgi:hypothetical protein
MYVCRTLDSTVTFVALAFALALPVVEDSDSDSNSGPLEGSAWEMMPQPSLLAEPSMPRQRRGLAGQASARRARGDAAVRRLTETGERGDLLLAAACVGHGELVVVAESMKARETER